MPPCPQHLRRPRSMPPPSTISPRASPASSPKPASPRPAPDPAAAARVDALEKSLAALRGELSGLRAQSEKLATAVNEVKSAPGESAAPPDLSAINERIAGSSAPLRAQSAEIAQENAKPADDVPLRRIVAAALLDVLVRTGDPYPAALAAAKSLAAEPGCAEAARWVCRLGRAERRGSQPRTADAGAETVAAGAGEFHHRLRPGRSPAGGRRETGPHRAHRRGRQRSAAMWSRGSPRRRCATISTKRRRELNTLAPADRAAAQAWIDKADARDAALAASRQFAAEAMTALAKPAQ